MHVIADSLLKDIDGIIHERKPRNWILTFDVIEGKEALDMPCPQDLDGYDHIIICSAGNGMWKPLNGPAWNNS